MKTYKWLFLLLPVAAVLISCGGESEEELIGNWKIRGDFGGPPRGHAATFIIGDKGYVVGGFNGRDNARLKDVWEYDNTGGQWRRKTPLPDGALARQQAVGFSVNGKGYIGTGMGINSEREEVNLADFWEFDPAGNGGEGSWRQVASPEGAGERHSAIAFSLKTGDKEYGYMGTGRKDATLEVLTDFWRFDPDGGALDGEGKPMGTWTQIDSYRGSKRYGATAFVIDNKAYVCTGSSTSSTVTDLWVFDPNAAEGSQWEGEPKRRRMYPANQNEDYDDAYGDLPRSYAVSFTCNVAGETRGFIALGNKNTVWEYSPGEDLWVQRTSFYSSNQLSSREGSVAFSFPGTNQCFVGCGLSGGTTPYDDFREFFPTAEDDTFDDIR